MTTSHEPRRPSGSFVRRVRAVVITVLASGLALGVGLGVQAARPATGAPLPQQAGNDAYYVDCQSGSDANAGTSPNTAWRSVTRAGQAPLTPGDALLFERGCTWSGERLNAIWSGTADARIRIGAYGRGSRPVLRSSANHTVRVSGSYLIVEGLRLEAIPTRFTECGQPLGTMNGISVVSPARNNVVRDNQATGFAAGIRLARGTAFNTVQNNELFGNRMLDAFNADPSRDLGARGILVLGDDNDISYNLLIDNTAVCRNQGYKLHSNSIELYEAQRNRIHHNRSFGDRVFSELGSSATKRASGNVYAYNEVISDLEDTRFIVTRGAQDPNYGPVRTTTVVHNSVRYTGPGSTGVSCGLGCGPTVLTMVGNIIWAEEKVVFADAPFFERDNLYWENVGTPFFQVPGGISATSLVADPEFADLSAGLAVGATSPAIDEVGALPSGVPPVIVRTDLAGTNVPQGGRRDIGAYELGR